MRIINPFLFWLGIALIACMSLVVAAGAAAAFWEADMNEEGLFGMGLAFTGLIAGSLMAGYSTEGVAS